MAGIFVVNAMHLGALEEVADPARSLDIRMIEEFARCCTKRINCTCLQVQTQECINQEASDNRVHDHLERVLVERGDHLDALRAMVNLMEREPQKVDAMSPAMPPVKDERCNEVC
jgi:predicted metal-dependent hydrolase